MARCTARVSARRCAASLHRVSPREHPTFVDPPRSTSAGAADGPRSRVHPDNVVRIEFDADAGTLSYWVNDAPQGVCFRGLAGRELFPAVCFYSTGAAAWLRSGRVGAPVALLPLSRGSSAAMPTLASPHPRFPSYRAVRDAARR